MPDDTWSRLLRWCQGDPARLSWLLIGWRRKAVQDVLERIEATGTIEEVRRVVEQERKRFGLGANP